MINKFDIEFNPTHVGIETNNEYQVEPGEDKLFKKSEFYFVRNKEGTRWCVNSIDLEKYFVEL